MSSFWKMYEEVKAHEQEQAPQPVTNNNIIKPKDPESPQTIKEPTTEAAEPVAETGEVEVESEEINGTTSNTDL